MHSRPPMNNSTAPQQANFPITLSGPTQQPGRGTRKPSGLKRIGSNTTGAPPQLWEKAGMPMTRRLSRGRQQIGKLGYQFLERIRGVQQMQSRARWMRLHSVFEREI